MLNAHYEANADPKSSNPKFRDLEKRVYLEECVNYNFKLIALIMSFVNPELQIVREFGIGKFVGSGDYTLLTFIIKMIKFTLEFYMKSGLK